jgi:hypothetical protein
VLQTLESEEMKSQNARRNLNLRDPRGSAIWVATGSAVLGVACIIWFLSVENSQLYSLIAAQAAAITGLLAILLSAILTLVQGRQDADRVFAGNGPRDCQAQSESAAGARKRRQVLNQRLEIDEPKLCSQHLIRCTCWSFCAGAEETRLALAAGLPQALRPDPSRNFAPDTARLSVVHRNGRNDCPFRHASPSNGSRSAEGETPQTDDS